MTIHESNYMDEGEVRYQRTRVIYDDPFNRKAQALIERLDAILQPAQLKEEQSANTPAVQPLQ